MLLGEIRAIVWRKFARLDVHTVNECFVWIKKFFRTSRRVFCGVYFNNSRLDDANDDDDGVADDDFRIFYGFSLIATTRYKCKKKRIFFYCRRWKIH